MSITALEIQEVRFGEVKKGYDPNEVDEFLERVATDVDTLSRALSEAAARIKAAEARAEEAEQRAAQAEAVPSVFEPAPSVKPLEPAVSEDIISKAFIAAQKSADAIQDEARKEAEKVYREAEAKGRDIVREALAEKQKAIGELDRLRESCEQFRTEYLSLLKHFQSDAQKRLAAFDDVVPAQNIVEPQPQPQSQSVMNNPISANDAVVSPSPSLSNTTVRPSTVTSGVILSPAAMGLEDDDELDIEEID